MSLDSLHVGPVIPVIPVSDLSRSVEFYEGTLGLAGSPVPGGSGLRRGDGSVMYRLPGTSCAGQAEWPRAAFAIERGIVDLEDVCIAWFRDPGNQVFSIFERV